jgi:hypothetical protein
MKNGIWFLAGLIVCACDTSPSSEKLVPGCYAYIKNGSTIFLEIFSSEEVISGNLTYHLSGKDKNIGTIDGRQNGDTLIADYTFISEGIESVRQVAFLVNDSVLLEGFGEVTTEGNRSKFKELNSLSFSSAMPLSKSTCPVEE